MGIIDEIKERVSMEDLLSLYNIHKVRGTNIYKCFSHTDNHPSASIIKNANKFHCFVCNKTWDIFDVVSEIENCSLTQAIKIIDTKMGLNIARQLSEEEKKEFEDLQRQRKKNRELKELRERWELEVRNNLTAKLKLLDNLEHCLHPTRGEVRLNKWEDSTIYFTVLKEQERLETLYDLLYNTDSPDNIYYYNYGTNKTQIYARIKSGEIKI